MVTSKRQMRPVKSIPDSWLCPDICQVSRKKMTIVDAMAKWLEENIPYELPPELWRIIAQTAATHVCKMELHLEIRQITIWHVVHL